ncbi:MAG TPA: hypothetical protein PKI16_00150 [Candidatus Dojkabacteria bacterium]|nr:hypothetical protein [Candidatus Dojkabacteria bacterium]
MIKRYLSILFLVAIIGLLQINKVSAELVCGGTWCSIGTISCPCPDGTCYMHCTRACRTCTETSIPETKTSCSSIDGTYPNGSSVECCVRDCDSTCTLPACPRGYTDNTSLTSCTTVYTPKPSCDIGGEDCGTDCGSRTRNCYLLETNVAPSMPTSVKIVVDNVTYNLSTNSNTPTRIKLPSTASNVQVKEPTTTFPSTSNGGGYAFKGFNDGVNDEWAAITTCTPTSCAGVAGEDFFIKDTVNIQDFDPTTKTILQVLKENADGKIAGMYYTINKCNTTKQYSLPIEGYYEVDNIPDSNITIDITIDKTAKNCTSTTYTGLDINNPLKFNASVTDADSNDEIEALIIWFSKDETVPPLVNITGTYTQSNTNDFGIMIRKNAGSWNTPLIYSTNTDNTWRLLTAADKLAVQGLTITQGASLDISFGLEFKPTANNPSGLYNVYGTAVDSYMINNNIVDQSRIQDLFNWGIDLANPTVNDITQTVKDVNSVYLDWSANDNESSIMRTVINGYRTGGSITNDLEMFLPPDYTTSKGTITLTQIPEETLIGMFDDTNAWRFTNTSSQVDLINVGENEGGMISTYVTAYDMGCNTNAQYKDINLNPWITSKGGFVYSSSGITNAAKDVAGLPALDGVFVKLTSAELDTGTELISARNDILPELLHPELKAVRALNVYDSNDRKTYWFDHFKEKLATEKVPGTTKIATPTSSCASGICYVYSTNNITLNTGFNCTSKILVMSEGNITINPDITSSSTNTGCIFLAKGNIYIGAGTYKTGVNTNVHYDYLDAYLMAEGQIIFNLVDTDKSVRDGIEINGGMVAFGNGVTGGSAINVLRNLKLSNISNPTVVINYDYKYPNIATQFFGVEAPIYKQEIGFKSF